MLLADFPRTQIFHLTPTPPTYTTSSSVPSTWSANLINVLNHGDPTSPSPAAPITCILPMPHNVYTGDEEGRVVRSTFPYIGEWLSRKAGHQNKVEWRAGRGTTAVCLPSAG
jgi:hypothetical protein